MRVGLCDDWAQLSKAARRERAPAMAQNPSHDLLGSSVPMDGRVWDSAYVCGVTKSFSESVSALVARQTSTASAVVGVDAELDHGVEGVGRAEAGGSPTS